jgi:uncharacterized protein YciI
MLFVCLAYDKPNSVALRMATRPKHLDYLKQTGVLKFGGPFINDKDEMIGGLAIIEAADLEAAKKWQLNDPYQAVNLFARFECHPWRFGSSTFDKS